MGMVYQIRGWIYWSLKVMGTSTQLATGLPSARAGAKRHIQTALLAVPSRIWYPELSLICTAATRPSSRTRTLRSAVP